MKRNTTRKISVFATAVLIGIVSPQASQAAEDAGQPNLVIIIADDLGYGDLSCYGQKHFQTPRLDRMARDGMLFTQAYSGCTVCAASRACLLTGQHTGHVFQRFNGNVQFRENPQDVTVATLLKNAGYRTAMIGKSGLSCNSDDGRLPNRKGFDHFFGFTSHGAAHRYYPKSLWRNGEQVEYPDNNWKKGEHYTGDLFLKETMDWLAENAKSGPFFLHFSPQQPHADLAVPDNYRKPFIGKYKEKPHPKGQHYRAELHPKATYAGMVTYLDDTVGQVLDKLRELSVAENTLVIFASDNGPHFEGGAHPDYFDSNGPLRGGKRDFYEGGIRTPMIAWSSGTVKAGSNSDHICAFWDFPATACDLAGADPPKANDGISFAPTLLGKEHQPEHDYLYWEFYERGGKQAVRMDRWKGIRLNVSEDRNGPIELYDLKADLGETSNVVDNHADVAARIRDIMNDAHVPSPLISFGR